MRLPLPLLFLLLAGSSHALLQAAEAEQAAAATLPMITVQPLPEAAQDAPVEQALAAAPVALEPITVTATRTPKPVSAVAASVSVVSAREIEYRQASSLGEVFRDLPGVAMEGGPRANAEFVNIRGLSGPRVLLIVDGARQNFFGGHRSSLLADPDLLKQVELQRGPASALWGSDALGGVVVMSSKDAKDFLKGDDRFATRFRLGYEANNGERVASGVAAARLGSLDGVFNLVRRSAGDFQRADGSSAAHTGSGMAASLAKLSWLPADSPHSMGLIHQSFRQSSVSPSNPATEVTDTNPLLDRSNDTAYTVARYGFEGSGWVKAAQLNVYRDALEIREDRVAAPRNDRTFFKTDGVNGHLTIPAPFGFGGIRPLTLFTLGADGFKDSSRATRNGAPRPQFPDAERELAGAFLQAEIPLGPLSVVPGIRQDRYHSKTNQTDTDDVRESATSPKLGLVYEVFEGVKLRSSYNGAFRAPGLIEIYAAGQHFLGNQFVPNPNLRPEKARNLELGFSVDVPGFGSGQQALFSGSVYRNRIKDFIELFVEATAEFPAPQCVSPMPPVGCVNRNEDGTLNPISVPVFVGGTTSSRNLESATLRGGEVETAYRLGPLKLGMNYSQVRGVDDVTGEPLLNIAADRLRSTLELRPRTGFARGLQTTLGFTRNLPQNRVPTFVDEDGVRQDAIPKTPGYNTWDLNLSYEPLGRSGRQFGVVAPRLTLGVDNLTNEDYRDHLNVLQSPGRNVRGALSFGF